MDIRTPWSPDVRAVNWGEGLEPIHDLNQPHLYFYFLAGWGNLVGWEEVPMHILQALFTFASLYFFYQIARITVPANTAVLLTALFGLSPALVINQNLMTDIPLLACWLGFFYWLVNPNARSDLHRYLYAALFASAALLIKYTSLPLIPILVLHILVVRQYRYLPVVAVPLLTLAAWSLFNYLDYGSIHIADRPLGTADRPSFVELGLSWIATLGAVAPFTVLFLPAAMRVLGSLFPSKEVFIVMLVVAVGCAVSLMAYLVLQPDDLVDFVLKILFMGNGVFLLLLVAWKLIGALLDSRRSTAVLTLIRQPENLFNATMLCWLLGPALFVVLFSPFMATRHVLLSIPPILFLLGSCLKSRVGPPFAVTALCFTVLLTANLAIADWQFADYYRVRARQIAAELSGGTLWFGGHWGWQWYARHEGMAQLHWPHSSVASGDYIILPDAIPRQAVPADVRLKEIRVYPPEPLQWTCCSTSNGAASFYAARFLPWNIARSPLGSIRVYQVVD